MRKFSWFVLVSLVLPLCGMVPASAQDAPPLFPAVSSEPFAPGGDPDVQPVQFTTPASLQVPSNVGTRAVVDPPPAMVSLHVRVPADSPPGDDIKYQIIIRNTSNAEAHRVMVRNPMPEGVAEVVKADPIWSEPKPAGALTAAAPGTKFTGRELVWSFGTLKPGETKTIELVLRPRTDATEVKNIAYVRFEHGEAVTTKIRKPALKIAKQAPKSTVRDEPFKVSIIVENTSRVATANVRVTENVPAAAEFEALTGGAKKNTNGQWQWTLGTMMPGQRKLIEYRLTPRQVTETLTTTHVDADKSVLETAEARTAVLVPGLTLKLDGPKGIVGPGESARYEVTVRNTGTLPGTNIRMTASLPADCKPNSMTTGGSLFRDQIVWTIPRLEAGEARSFRFGLKAPTSGSRIVGAHAIDARGLKSQEETATVFQGTASLVWETVPDPASVYVGRQGTFTVRIKNTGSEPAANVRLEVEVPPDVDVVQATRDVRPVGRKLSFGPETIARQREAVFTVTYKATRSSAAWFRAKLSADALGDKPLSTEKMVDILGSTGG